MKFSMEVSLENNPDFSSFLNTMIKEFNNEHSVHHKKVRDKGSVQPINIIVSDEDNRWIGGMTAEVYWDWLEINDFWFDKQFRGQGLGRALLSKIEEIALGKGAKKVHVYYVRISSSLVL